MTIRPATEADLPVITEIYNEAVLTSTATFDLEPKSLEDRRQWLTKRSPRHAVLVAVSGNKVVGWASLNPFSERAGYDGSAENSVYIASEERAKGIGSLLLAALLEHARKHGIHSIIARVATERAESIRLHEKFGFIQVGTLKEIGRKFDRYLDVHFMQRIIT